MANKRNKLKEEFKLYLDECNRVSVNTSYVNYSDRCDLSFFEWSDLDSTPKKFNSGSEFFKFLDSCKISYNDSQKTEFRTKYILYATCFPNSNVLALSNSKNNLSTLLNKYKDVIPPINERSYFGQQCNYNYSSYPYGRYNEVYDDCWD
jgi:hypothetical protein